MPTAQDFHSFTAAVFPSQSAEVVLDKQPVLAAYGQDLRQVINQLPPEASRTLLGEYGAAGPELVNVVKEAILRREFASEMAQQASPSQEWLNAAEAHRSGIDEATVAADDTWNAAP
ncbi:UNVERIFIED_ORG: hypothetical protein J2W65_002681 [Pseudomonas parafulva]|jgi:hypothetical protein|uniref:hypothetical protein n=1 Tax=Pseudomonas TaxID=286 RepID=UPI002446C2C6|nr:MULTISPECIES: hypothetical protein [Pseudomonas]MDH0617476.1 hypothetical protein [Pseudomonas fulva]MDH1305307.1 hypothetical protein [Pseudomonas fulva]MDP9557040.1 hypothetical protein [Pseudomonas parafulva]